MLKCLYKNTSSRVKTPGDSDNESNKGQVQQAESMCHHLKKNY